MLTNNLEVSKWLDNEIMDLSMDEEKITNMMVASIKFEVDVQETFSVI